MSKYQRFLKPPTRSFFLFGPRGVGKSTWLKQQFPKVTFIDLLDNKTYLELSLKPGLLEGMVTPLPKNSWICIDEIQKIPALLDEVHRLMESDQFGHLRFILCGSSARKLKRGGANLLAGRASAIHMESFVSEEIKSRFNFEQTLEWGTLPMVVNEPKNAREILQSYFYTYIKEEIKEESLIRKLDPFLRFLEIAGIMNGQQVNASNIANEARIPRGNVENYFSILVDTLLGHFLPPYQPGAQVREQSHPKFYWFDTGLARASAGLLNQPLESSWKGFALETLVFHELRVYNQAFQKFKTIAYYRTGSGVEIDFVIELKKKVGNQMPEIICLEVKLAKDWNRKWEKPIRFLAESKKVHVKKMIGIYLGSRQLEFDGFKIYPIVDFLKALYAKKIY